MKSEATIGFSPHFCLATSSHTIFREFRQASSKLICLIVVYSLVSKYFLGFLVGRSEAGWKCDLFKGCFFSMVSYGLLISDCNSLLLSEHLHLIFHACLYSAILLQLLKYFKLKVMILAKKSTENLYCGNIYIHQSQLFIDRKSVV